MVMPKVKTKKQHTKTTLFLQYQYPYCQTDITKVDFNDSIDSVA